MAILKHALALLYAILLAACAALFSCVGDTQPGVSGSFELVLPGTHLKTSARITPPKVSPPAEPAIAPVAIPASSPEK